MKLKTGTVTSFKSLYVHCRPSAKVNAVYLVNETN